MLEVPVPQALGAAGSFLVLCLTSSSRKFLKRSLSAPQTRQLPRASLQDENEDKWEVVSRHLSPGEEPGCSLCCGRGTGLIKEQPGGGLDTSGFAGMSPLPNKLLALGTAQEWEMSHQERQTQGGKQPWSAWPCQAAWREEGGGCEPGNTPHQAA